jgi:hypothetical protein
MVDAATKARQVSYAWLVGNRVERVLLATAEGSLRSIMSFEGLLLAHGKLGPPCCW